MKISKEWKPLTDPLVINNPVSVQVLGVCSSLAVTVKLEQAIVMGLAVTCVTGASNLVLSLLRKGIPNRIRMIVELCVIATMVILVDQLLKAFSYEMSKALSVFVGLIITNCIVMGRAEAFALGNPPLMALKDGIGNGLGYSIVLCVVGAIREIFGSGKLLGFQVVPDSLYALGYENLGLMTLAPGAFILIGLFVWAQNTLFPPKKSGH